jgi:hypothetical protein
MGLSRIAPRGTVADQHGTTRINKNNIPAGPRRLSAMRSLDAQVSQSLSNEPLMATMSAVFGVLATALAVVGSYGGSARRRPRADATSRSHRTDAGHCTPIDGWRLASDAVAGACPFIDPRMTQIFADATWASRERGWLARREGA